jgi:hypothetical protein
MTRRICAVSRKGRIIRDTDIFIGGDGSGLGFGAGVGEQPTGKAAGEATRNACATWARCRSDVARCARHWFLDFGLRLVRFRLNNWGSLSGGERLSAIFG